MKMKRKVNIEQGKKGFQKRTRPEPLESLADSLLVASEDIKEDTKTASARIRAIEQEGRDAKATLNAKVIAYVGSDECSIDELLRLSKAFPAAKRHLNAIAQGVDQHISRVALEAETGPYGEYMAAARRSTGPSLGLALQIDKDMSDDDIELLAGSMDAWVKSIQPKTNRFASDGVGYYRVTFNTGTNLALDVREDGRATFHTIPKSHEADYDSLIGALHYAREHGQSVPHNGPRIDGTLFKSVDYRDLDLNFEDEQY